PGEQAGMRACSRCDGAGCADPSNGSTFSGDAGPDVDDQGNLYPKGKTGRIATRHPGGANFMFGDGHAKYMKPGQWAGVVNGVNYYYFWRLLSGFNTSKG